MENRKKEPGFALVEILVTVLILGIFAAAMIPMALNQHKAAVDVQVQSDVKSAAKVLEQWSDSLNGRQKELPAGLIAKSGEGVSMSNPEDAADPENKIFYDIKVSSGTTLTFGGNSKRYVIQGTNNEGTSSNVEVERSPDTKKDLTGVVYDSRDGLKVK